MKLEFSRQIFEKFSNFKFHENPFIDSEFSLRTDGRTGRHDEFPSRISQFCKRD